MVLTAVATHSQRGFELALSIPGIGFPAPTILPTYRTHDEREVGQRVRMIAASGSPY